MPKTITQNWLHYGSESWITKHAGLRVGSSPGNGQSARRRDRRKDVRRLSTDPDLGTRNSGSENCLDPTICSVVVVHVLSLQTCTRQTNHLIWINLLNVAAADHYNCVESRQRVEEVMPESICYTVVCGNQTVHVRKNTGKR